MSSTETDRVVCVRCGRGVSTVVAGGLCPACVLATALVGDDVEIAEGGRSFGRYELLGELGRGGMGVVYRALHGQLGRVEALKMALPAQIVSPAERERFHREAEAIASLEHPHILPIYEVGEHRGQPFFTMKLCVRSLAEEWRSGGPGRTPEEAARLAMGLALAVHYAHERGIQHRDLKPSNILLDANGCAFVSDFGLARFRDRDSTLTHSAAVLGSPAYMAPEVAQGRRDLTNAADIYSLGAILYELLTGHPPFTATSVVEMLRLVVEREPQPPRRLVRSVPRDLETICLKCLRKEPSARYASARELAEDLARFLAGESVRARRAPTAERFWRWCRRRPAVAALLAVLVLGSVAAVWQIDAARRAEGREKVHAEAVSSQLRQSNTQLDETNSRLGEMIDQVELQRAEDLFHEGESGRALLFLVRVLERHPGHPVAAPRLASALFHGEYARPSGLPFVVMGKVIHLEFLDDETLFICPRNGAPGLWKAATGEQRLSLEYDGLAWLHARLSSDRSTALGMAYLGAGAVWNVATGKLQAPRISSEFGGHWVVFSADGKRAANCRLDGLIRFWDATSGEMIGTPQSNGKNFSLATMSADGRRIAVEEDGRVGLWEVESQRKVRDFPALLPPVKRLAFSPDGSVLCAAAGDFAAHRFATETGAEILPALQHEGKIEDLQFASDGRRILTASVDRTARLWDATTGTQLIPPLRHRDWVNTATFCPDGRRIATTSGDLTARLWDAATGRPVSQPMAHLQQPLAAVMSRDGNTLYTGGADIFVRRWDLRPVAEPPAILGSGVATIAAEFCADGRSVATVADDGSASLWRIDKPTPVLAWRGAAPVARSRVASFSPDGVLFAAAEGAAIMVRRVASPEEALVSIPCERAVLDVDFSADGQRLAVAQDDGAARIWNVADGTSATPVLEHAAPVAHIRFSPDGGRVMTAERQADLTKTLGRTAQMWDARSGSRIGTAILDEEDLHDTTMSADGRLVATASNKDQARVWDAATGLPVTPPLRHPRAVQAVIFSADSRLVATGSLDGTARVWDARTGQPTVGAMQHDDHVLGVAFSPDGKRLATASRDGTARLWDVATGLPITEPLRHPSAVRAVRFSPDGQRLLTVSEGCAARIWAVPRFSGPPPAWLNAAARVLAVDKSVAGREDEIIGSLSEFAKLQRRAEADPGAGDWARLARGFFPREVADKLITPPPAR